MCCLVCCICCYFCAVLRFVLSLFLFVLLLCCCVLLCYLCAVWCVVFVVICVLSCVFCCVLLCYFCAVVCVMLSLLLFPNCPVCCVEFVVVSVLSCVLLLLLYCLAQCFPLVGPGITAGNIKYKISFLGLAGIAAAISRTRRGAAQTQQTVQLCRRVDLFVNSTLMIPHVVSPRNLNIYACVGQCTPLTSLRATILSKINANTTSCCTALSFEPAGFLVAETSASLTIYNSLSITDLVVKKCGCVSNPDSRPQ